MADSPLLEQLDQAIDALLRGEAQPAEPARLVLIAAELRHLPDERFKARLKTELQRKSPMTATAYTTIREGFRTVTPYINVTDGDRFIEFLKGAFGAVEVLRHTVSPDAFHAEVRIGDSMLMIGASPHGNNPGRFHVFVEDCDAVFRNAIAAGGKSLGEPADRPYGERSGFVEDVFGNMWYIATPLAGTPLPGTPAREHAGTVVPYLHPTKARGYIDFLNRAFGAEELFVVEHNGVVPHAAVRIGDAVIEMGEGPSQRAPSGFFMYVEDVDAVYARAVAAGATGVRPPANQSYGHRDATVRDLYGYTWNPASLI
ncbi:MAG TPA: VOC family protein [Bryobacteraceae bacterium]|jgi:PhnB protein|nr:VOC family protein [Bryobacteraceae bacterium]